jgi:hypothetical protein
MGDAFLALEALPPLKPMADWRVTDLRAELRNLVDFLPEDVLIVTGHVAWLSVFAGGGNPIQSGR